MPYDFFTDGRLQRAQTFEEFQRESEELNIHTKHSEINELALQHAEYRKLNIHRTKRILKTYKPGENISELLKSVTEDQYWMVLTEDWCGDSAQNLPYFAIWSRINVRIKLRILKRDENPDIMDHFLTNGTSRSIPKIVGFNSNGEVIFQWGPRPAAAQNLVTELKETGCTKEDINKDLHLWYARNRGEELEKEFSEILSNIYNSVI